jgi:hypothetical protein
MNTIKNCAAICPIVSELPDDSRHELLIAHRTVCLERRMGQMGILCGIPQGEEKDKFSYTARQLGRSLVAVEV